MPYAYPSRVALHQRLVRPPHPNKQTSPPTFLGMKGAGKGRLVGVGAKQPSPLLKYPCAKSLSKQLFDLFRFRRLLIGRLGWGGLTNNPEFKRMGGRKLSQDAGSQLLHNEGTKTNFLGMKGPGGVLFRLNSLPPRGLEPRRTMSMAF